MTYVPEWARESSPTAGLSQDAMLKYYKDHSVAGWCRFYLENPGDTSPALLQAIQALADSCQTKQKPAHKAAREVLARRWQTEAADRNSRDVPRITHTRRDDVTMWDWPPRAESGAKQPRQAVSRRVIALPVVPQTISFNPARILARFERRRAA